MATKKEPVTLGNLRGSTEPRLWTRPLVRLTARTSDGPAFLAWWRETLCAPLANGLTAFPPPMPWQEWLALHLLELRPDGRYRFKVVLILIARQNGKTTFLVALSLWKLFQKSGMEDILGTAQDLATAAEALNQCMEITEDLAELDNLTAKRMRSNGKESLILSNRRRYLIRATSRRAGRGLSIDQLNLDELREQTDYLAWGALSKTTMARENAQIIAISNAGDDSSIVLNDLRGIALGETEDAEDLAPGLFEWSAPEHMACNDPRGWRSANPALGITLDELAIKSALKTDPEAVFRTEVLCQRVPTLAEMAVQDVDWEACRTGSTDLKPYRARVACFVDVAMDGHHVTLMAAAVDTDGHIVCDIVAAWGSVTEATARLAHVLARVRPAKLGWFGGKGPQEILEPIMTRLGRAYRIEKVAHVNAACMGLASVVSARQLRHNGDDLTTTHVLAAKKLPSGDGWRFVRKGEGNVDAAYALAGAVLLARAIEPTAGHRRIRVITAGGRK